MSNFLEVRLSDDQLDALAERIVRRMAKDCTGDKPLTLRETGNALGVSEGTIRNRIKAGTIRTVQGIGVPRVAQSEVRRLKGEDE